MMPHFTLCLLASTFVIVSQWIGAAGQPPTAGNANRPHHALVALAAPTDQGRQPAEKPSAEQILKEAGKRLFPEEFSAEIEMIQHKPGQEDFVSRLLLYKKNKDLVRADYIYPPHQAGQRLLRREGQIWMYLPDTKRVIKMSPRQSLGGSDFNNGDIMRLNYEEDYTPTIAEETDTTWVLELRAKNRSVTYDRILYTISKDGYQSIKQAFYTLSGKLIKTLEFKQPRNYGGLLRPSLFVMSSNLVDGMYTELTYLRFEVGKSLPMSEFRPDAMARH